MIHFLPVKTPDNIHFQSLTALYQSAFPRSERREIPELIRKMELEAKFHCRAILINEKFAGLFNTWHFGTFIYVEHFAVSEVLRGQNIGSKALTLFMRQHTLPLVLEVEPPENTTAERRIGFYERHGLNVVEKNYQQPPYRDDDEAIPLFLMCNHALPVNCIENIYQYVYDVKSL